MKLKILQTEASTGLGGEEFRVLAEVEGLMKRGHQVLLVAQPGSELEAIALKQALPVASVEMGKRSFPQAMYRFRRLIDQYEFDIVNTHGSNDSWVGAIASRFSRSRPIVIRTRHKSTPIANHPLNRLLYQSLTNKIITTGEKVKQQLIEENGYDGDRLCSIPTGVDLNIFYPQENDGVLRKEWGIRKDEFLVGIVSFLRGYKGVSYFIEAARTLSQQTPGVRFLIVGDGPERESLKEKIEGLGLSEKIIMLGHREDIPKILSVLDLLVLTSTSAEGLPQVLTQAMSMGKPVVASDVGAVSEVVQHSVTGILVPPGDPGAISNAMLLLMKDKDLCHRLADEAKKLVQAQYNSNVMLDQLESLYIDSVRRHKFLVL